MKFKEGDCILINQNIDRTERRFQCTDEMWKMRGKIFTIESVHYPERSAYVNGFTWDVRDFSHAVVEKEPQIFHFDIERLEYEERT